MRQWSMPPSVPLPRIAAMLSQADSEVPELADQLEAQEHPNEWKTDTRRLTFNGKSWSLAAAECGR